MRTFGKWLGRLLLLVVAALAAFFIFAPGYVEQARNGVTDYPPFEVSADAQALHDALVIGDWHADSLLWKRSILDRADRGHVDLPRLREGNVAVQVFTAVTKSPAGQNYEANRTDARDNITLLAIGQLWPIRTWQSIYERAAYQAQKLQAVEAAAPDQLKIIRSVADLNAVLAARAEGRQITGGILGMEGGHPLEGDIANLDRLWDEGYRLMGLQHFFDNELGGSLHGQGDLGLTEFGRTVLARLVSDGWIIDLAHSSPQVVRDVIDLTDVPLVISHTGLHSHCETKRNLPDDLMRAVVASGGVIGIGYWADVTCDDSPKGVAATIKAAIATVGEDAVSLGSDYDGSVTTGFDTSQLAALTHELIAAGVTRDQIAKVMGGNMMRVLRARLPQ